MARTNLPSRLDDASVPVSPGLACRARGAPAMPAAPAAAEAASPSATGPASGPPPGGWPSWTGAPAVVARPVAEPSPPPAAAAPPAPPARSRPSDAPSGVAAGVDLSVAPPALALPVASSADTRLSLASSLNPSVRARTRVTDSARRLERSKFGDRARRRRPPLRFGFSRPPPPPPPPPPTGPPGPDLERSPDPDCTDPRRGGEFGPPRPPRPPLPTPPCTLSNAAVDTALRRAFPAAPMTSL